MLRGQFTVPYDKTNTHARTFMTRRTHNTHIHDKANTHTHAHSCKDRSDRTHILTLALALHPSLSHIHERHIQMSSLTDVDIKT